MTVTKADKEAAIKQGKRDLVLVKAGSNVPLSAWRRAAEFGINKRDADEDETMIVIAHVKTRKSFDELIETGPIDIINFIVGEELAYTDEELVEATKTA